MPPRAKSANADGQGPDVKAGKALDTPSESDVKGASIDAIVDKDPPSEDTANVDIVGSLNQEPPTAAVEHQDGLKVGAESVKPDQHFDTPYGKMTWPQILDMARAELAARGEEISFPASWKGREPHLAGAPREDKPADICGTCFSGGWDEHPTAKNSDTVKCRHGRFSRRG